VLDGSSEPPQRGRGNFAHCGLLAYLRNGCSSSVCHVCGAFDVAFAKLLWPLVSFPRTQMDSTIAIASPSVRPSHTSDPRLNGSRYRKTFCTIRYNDV